MSEAGEPRYAVYYAPAVGSAWWQFGAGWLGRDELLDTQLPQPRLPGMPALEFRALTAEPRRYGFHGTLKAPFRLRHGVSESLLLQRLAAVAARLSSVPLGPLVPVLIDDFVALEPAVREPAVDALAAQCVLGLDDLRAPLTPQELERRRPEQLDATGRELLSLHGYPHVLGRFRFHMTLSGSIAARDAELLLRHAAGMVDALQRAQGPARLDRLCLFRQAAADRPFIRIHDEELAP